MDAALPWDAKPSRRKPLPLYLTTVLALHNTALIPIFPRVIKCFLGSQLGMMYWPFNGLLTGSTKSQITLGKVTVPI